MLGNAMLREYMNLLADNILNAVGQTLVIVVAESGVSLVKLGKEPIVLNVVLKDVLVIAHHL